MRAIRDWLRIKRLSIKERTAGRYEQLLYSISHVLPKKSWAEMTQDDIIGGYEALRATYSPRTVRHAHVVLKQFYRWLMSNGRAEESPVPPFAPLVTSHRSDVVLSREQIQILLKITKEHPLLSPNLHVMVAIALGTGMRLGEMLALEWADFQGSTLAVRRSLSMIAGKGLVVQTPKTTRSTRDVPISAELKAVLDAHRRSQPGGFRYILSSRSGRHISPNNIGKSYRTLVKRCPDLPSALTIHDLRHTVVSHLLKEGVSIHVVSRLVGHKDVETTLSKYAHLLPGQTEGAADFLGTLL